MYRHSAALRMSSSGSSPKNSPLSPATSHEPEADISSELEKKRQEIEEEISRFKEQKEKEFRDFERDLRLKWKRSRSPNKAASGALGLLAGTNKDQANGKADRTSISRPSRAAKTPPLSQPTLSLEKLTINGVSVSSTNETSPAALNRTLSRSPSNSHLALTPPRSRPTTLPPPPGSKDHDDISLAGVFTPTYLPLLDSQNGDSQLPRSKSDRSGHGPLQSPALGSTGTQQQQRAYSVPAIPSPTMPGANLPSALRTSSDASFRKRKRVTFQLSDSAIVEPSSSYEEIPSPNAKQLSPDSLRGSYNGEKRDEGPSDENVELDSFHELDNNPDILNGPDVDAEAKAEAEVLETTGASFEANQQQGLIADSQDIIAPRLSHSNIQRSDSGSSEGSVNVSGPLQEAADGGSGVGFFELDEELDSPSLGEDRLFTQDDNENDAHDPPAEAADDIMDAEKKSANNQVDDDDLGGEELKYGSFSAGSLPINIISSKFVGSYGH